MNQTDHDFEKINRDPVLSSYQIYKSYGKVKILAGIDLTLKAGKVYGIVGENGSGKTTLMKILTGFVPPDSGDVSISGTTGFCPQEPLLFNYLTMRENLAFYARAYGLEYGSNHFLINRHVEEVIEKFSCSAWLDYRCSKLSGGTLQKVNFILSVLHDPDILFLDEPYSSFDWDTYLAFWEYVETTKRRNKTILIVSHLLYDKNRLDQTWKLQGGKLICE